MVELLLLLLLDARVLPLQGVDVCGHPLHHHTVEGRVVLTAAGIDGSRAQLRDVVGPRALFLARFCPRGKERKVSGGEPSKGEPSKEEQVSLPPTSGVVPKPPLAFYLVLALVCSCSP